MTTPFPARTAGANSLSLGLPFGFTAQGRTRTVNGDEALHDRIIQTLFTALGERVGLPEFGVGLDDYVFGVNDPMNRTFLEFAARRALEAWLSDEVSVDSVNVTAIEGGLSVELVYTNLSVLIPEILHLNLGGPS